MSESSLMELEDHNLAKSVEWEDVHQLPLSHVDILEAEIHDSQEFRPEWEPEFQKAQLRTVEIKCFCSLYAIYCVSHVILRLFSNESGGADGGYYWEVYTWLPEVAAAISCVSTVSLLHSILIGRSMFEKVASITILISFTSSMLPDLLLEIRRSKFTQGNNSSVEVLTIDYSSFPPIRSCSKGDPQLVSGALDTNYVSNCPSMVLSSQLHIFNLILSVLPRLFRIGTSAAIALVLTTAVIFVVALLLVGLLPADWIALSAVAFQIIVGLGCAAACARKRRAERAEFALAKRIEYTTRQTRNLLHTLIPRNVSERLGRHRDSGMLGAEIRQASRSPSERASERESERERERERERRRESEMEGGREGGRESQGAGTRACTTLERKEGDRMMKGERDGQRKTERDGQREKESA
jgi:hypothetical protein